MLAKQFLDENASQLTFHGLCELNARMKPEELAVIFRNNHFSTLYKRDDVRNRSCLQNKLQRCFIPSTLEYNNVALFFGCFVYVVWSFAEGCHKYPRI